MQKHAGKNNATHLKPVIQNKIMFKELHACKPIGNKKLRTMKSPDHTILKIVYKFAWQTITLYELMAEARDCSAGDREQDKNSRISTVKFSEAYKKARKKYRWLKSLYDNGDIPYKKVGPLLDDCGEVLRLIGNDPGNLHSQSRAASAKSFKNTQSRTQQKITNHKI